MSSSGNNRTFAFFNAVVLLLRATLRRTIAAPTATLALIFALCIPITLAVIVPSYANAAGIRILANQIERQTRQTQRPALALLFRAVRGTKPIPWRTIRAGDALMTENAGAFLQIPIASLTRHIRTIPYGVMAVEGDNGGAALGTAPFATLVGIDNLMTLVDGQRPVAGANPIQAMVSRSYANATGLNVGEEYVLTAKDGLRAVRITLVGIWQPKNALDPNWLYDPATLSSMVIVHNDDMLSTVAEAFPDGIAQAAWYLQPSEITFGPGQIGTLESRIRSLAQEMEKIPAKLERSPLASFRAVNQTISELTIRTGIISAPIALLAFFFVVQLASITYERRRDEYALLRSRGMTLVRLMSVGGVEWLVYIALATLPAIPLGLVSAGVMLRTQSFLQIGGPAFTLPGLPAQAWAVIAVVWVVVLAIGLRPLANASRRTLSDSGKSRRRDALSGVLRVLFEVLVLTAVGYGYYQLYENPSVDGDLFSNPLTLALPVLTSLAFALVANRLLPLFFGVAQHYARRTDSLVTILALQTIARRPERLQTTVLLLTLTLGVGGYVASMAATVDQATINGISYRTGADSILIETATTNRPQNGETSSGDVYLLTPLGAHSGLPGVRTYTGVGTYTAQVSLGSKQNDATLLAIDRVAFASVVPHFADTWFGAGNSLGNLMNQLARARDGAILSAALAGNTAIGDNIAVTIDIDGTQVSTKVRVVGIVNGWPGQYDSEKPFLVTNQSFIAEEMGFEPPTDVWMTRDVNITVGELVAATRAVGIPLLDIVDRQELLQHEFERPERQGLFGMLSVGFVAASGLSVMAIFVAALTVLRQRSIELGMLQALGMASQEARRAIFLEQGLMAGLGIACGMVAALVTTRTILPYLQAGVAPHPNTPPTSVLTAWGTLGVMLLLYIVAMIATAIVAFRAIRRLRIADAVKLGDEN
jgi:putative ABC transport system permease protein